MSTKTIFNLRKLADLASAWDRDFDMDSYAVTNDGHDADPDEIAEDPECGSCCCLLGIAGVGGMGRPQDFTNWDEYSDSLFPSIPHTSGLWNTTFGPDMISDLNDRINTLREVADDLEEEFSE